MPQAEKSIIRSLLDPTIKLDTLDLYDLDKGTSVQAQEMGQKDQGVMSKLAFWRSNTPTKVSAEQYRVLMSQSGSNTEV